MPGTALWTVVLISIVVSMQLELFILPGWFFSLAHLELFGIYVFPSQGVNRTLQLLLGTFVEGPCSWNTGRIPSAFVFVCAFYRRSTLKFTLTLKLIAHLRSTCWDCEYKRRNFCRNSCKFLKICFVSEFANYKSINFWHCVFFWIERRIPTGKYESKRTLLISSDGFLPPHYVGLSIQVQHLALPDSMLWQPAWKFGVFSIAAFFQCRWDVSPITHWVACVPERQELPCAKGWTGEMEEDVCPQSFKELSFVGWN